MKKYWFFLAILPVLLFWTINSAQASPIHPSTPNNDFQDPFIETLLYPSLTWELINQDSVTNFLMDDDLSYFQLSGIVFQSEELPDKPSADVVNYYLPYHMNSLGWNLVGFTDANLLFEAQYYNQSINQGAEIKIGRCSQFTSNNPSLSESYCIQIWINIDSFVKAPVTINNEFFAPQKHIIPQGEKINASLTVPFFSQRASDPNDNIILGYGNCTATLHDVGCVVTSYAMIYNYYQLGFTNPVQLNNSLKVAPGVFAQYQSSGCYNLWPNYVDLPDAPSGVSGSSWVYNSCPDVNCIDPNNVTLIDNELNQGHPVHVRVHWSGAAESSHSVVIIGHSGSDFYIHDPWALDSSTRTLTTGAIAPYVVDRVIATHGSVQNCNNPSPNSDQVGIYADTNYCGSYKIFGQGEWANPGAMGFGNDSVSSVKVGGNVKAILCKDDNFSGGCEEFTGNDSNLADNSIGDNSVSSMKVQSRGSASGTWTANYYDTIDRWWDNNNGNNFKCSENVGGPFLDKNYGTSGPCGMDGDTWIGDYNATINFPSGNYVFLVDHDDGAKLWLNGSNIADFGGSGSTTAVCPARYLNGNANLRAMLREDGGDARIKVTWTTDSSVCLPAAPSNLRATATTENSISFAWNDNSGNENGFRIYRWDGSIWQNIGAVSSNTTSYTDTSLACGLTYYYDVSAYNDNGEVISNGDYLTAQTSACPTAPNTPDNFRITGTTQTAISIGWNDVSNETGYKIYRWNGDGFVYLTTLSANVTSYTDQNLPCDADQFYEVSAFNTIGESTHTNWIVGRTTSCLGACSPVRNISVGGFDTRRNDSTGSQNVIILYGDSGWIETGPEFTYALDLTRNQMIKVELGNMNADLDIFVLSNESGMCHSSNLITFGNSQAIFQGEAGKRYYLVVDGYHGAVGDYRIDVIEFPKIFLPFVKK